MKKKILILAGGISKERLISLDTGLQVAKELKKNGYKVKISEPDGNLSKNINEFKPSVILGLTYRITDICERRLGKIIFKRSLGKISTHNDEKILTSLFNNIIYENKIPMAVTSNFNLNNFSSSKLLEKSFKRTISRLYELTSINYN